MLANLSKRALIVVFIGFISAFSTVKAANVTEKIDRLFAKWDSTESPGAAVAVLKDGSIVYKRGFGMANLDYDIPITPETVFRIASTSKQFTAFCIALLVEQGKISLDDDIRKYIPEMPNYGFPIKIRHLVYHTSGIRDSAFLLALAELPFGTFMTDEEMLALITRQKELNFKPGEEYAYSNSGYFLMSLIVKRFSGLTLREYAEKHIFEPLEMNHTHFHDDHTMIVKNRATGYSPGPEGAYKIDVSMGDYVGGDGIFTTVGDLCLWIQNFYHNQLGKGSQELIDLVLKPGTLNNSEKLSYAFGLVKFELGDIEIYSHSGAWVGYQAQILFFGKRHFGVVVLSNLGSGISPPALAQQIATFYFPSEFKEAMKERAIRTKTIQPKLTKEQLKTKAGEYYDPHSDTYICISLKGKTLVIQGIGINSSLIAESESHFKASNISVDVTFIESEEDTKSIELRQKGKDPVFLDEVKKVTSSEDQLEEYTGRYYCDDVQKAYDLIIENSMLRLKHKIHPLIFKPLVKDVFWGIEGNTSIRFHRNDQGKISGFSLKTERIFNISFTKIIENSR
jgi:CubicO group peptidase (beta-lactamase class C family)